MNQSDPLFEIITGKNVMQKAQNIHGKALVFIAGSSVWATELNRIKEIVRAEHIEPLPNSSSRIAGIISVRGEIVPVLSNSWCGRSADVSRSDGSSNSILLLHSKDESIGIAIEHVQGIEDIHAYDLGGLSSAEEPLKNLISCSVLVSSSGAVPLLDVKLMLEFLKAGVSSERYKIGQEQAISQGGDL